MTDTHSLTTALSSNHIDLTIAGWLDAHSRSPKMLKAYVDTINQYRRELRRIGHDLDSDVRKVCGKYLEVHTHITRHTFSQLMIKAGATLPELQARLGHESLATTGIYARALSSDVNSYADTITTILGIE